MTDRLPFGIRDLSEAAKFDTDTDTRTLTDAATRLSQNLNEYLERELEGAWRAGYDYVHVYTDTEPALAIGDHEPPDGNPFTYTETRYVFPTHATRPPEPPSLEYLYTYDLTTVPDHVLRAAFRGELDEFDRIGD